ncbi:ABC transporter permease [Luteolibacter pohnpeiensis]|nr:ABC transporter permease [Luteolibacter pohnpeiensis]
MLSSFTLISLIGVMLGVLVLVVVMAVYAGLERDVKARLLGFSPHILIRHQPMSYEEKDPMLDWPNIADRAMKIPSVVAATPYVTDNVILDFLSMQRPVQFHGIDTSDSVQVDGITKMLDLEHHPGSSADMGIDDRVVISSNVADQFGLGVGDTIRLYSTRNFDEVLKAYKSTENPPVREHFAEQWQGITTDLAAGWKTLNGKAAILISTLEPIYSTLDAISKSSIRTPEKELLDDILLAMNDRERDSTNQYFLFDPDDKASIDEGIDALGKTNAEDMDNEVLKNLKTIVLPKEAEVIGVYKASQMAVTPDLFVPLPLAQDLAGIGNSVQGVALRLENADQAESIRATVQNAFGPGWVINTWGDQYRTFFQLINQQRQMMYFALSFIVLISAFSMMAVMFTVTIQKRREIGVMKALGAAPGQIVRVFLYQGMILGVVGSVLGVFLGRVVIHFRGSLQAMFRTMGFDPFSSSFTGFGVLPAHNNPWEQAMFALMGFILCSVAALVPAFFAARSDAAKSLRNL